MLATLGVDRPMNRRASAHAVPIMDHSPCAVGWGSRTTRGLSMGFEYRKMAAVGRARKPQRSSTGTDIGTGRDCAAPLGAAGAARGLRKNIASVAMSRYLAISSPEVGRAACRE